MSFIGTAICGAMPDYRWTFAMCFIMGLGVGGMLPIVFALLAEIVPARPSTYLRPTSCSEKRSHFSAAGIVPPRCPFVFPVVFKARSEAVEEVEPLLHRLLEKGRTGYPPVSG